MQREQSPPNTLRTSRFEAFEERLALSASPLFELFGSSRDDLDFTLLERPEALYGDVSTMANAGQAWTDVSYVRSTYGLTGAGQTVAIIDTGIAYDHTSLGAGYGAGRRVVGGWDFAENDANPYDDGPAGFHGTHVAGIVGAQNVNWPGVATGVDLVALRVFDDAGNGHFGWVEQSLQWVIQHKNDYANPITTVNLSIGTTWNSNSVPNWANLEDEFLALKNAGIVITVSAGNSFQSYNAPGLSYPAASPYVIPVASVDSAGNLSSFSQRNSRVLAAPGQSIVSTVPDYLFSNDGVKNDFASASGTSMAAPWLAGASALVRQAMQQVGYAGINEDSIYNHLRNTADTVFDAATNANYYRVNLRRAIDNLMQQPSWGNVDYYFAAGRQATGDTTYTATATRTGIFTAEVLFSNAAGNVDLEVYDANNQLLASSAGANNGERVDVNVTAGQQLSIRVVGTNSSVAFRCTNLLATSGDTATVFGSTRDELFVFLPGSTTSRIAVNGVGYDFAASTIRNFYVQDGGGTDTVVVVGSGADETAAFSAGNAIVSTSSYYFNSSGGEFVHVHGNAGNDTATLYDTAGNDTFTGSPISGSMTGAGYSNNAHSFEVVNATFNAGGYDQAFLYGSIGDDRFEASSTSAFLQGPGFRLNTSGYDTVVGVGGWGNDIALLSDTTGNETFIGDAGAGSLSGNGFYLRAANFERVEARSSGGFDVAYLWDSSGDDYFGGSKVLAFFNGSGFSNYVESFDRVTAISTGGNDTANIYGTAGNDQFISNARSRRIQAADYVVQTENFRNLRAYGGGGFDTASPQELTRNDTISGRGDWFTVANGDVATSYGFEQVNAAAKAGHKPRADVQAVDYVFSKSGF